MTKLVKKHHLAVDSVLITDASPGLNRGSTSGSPPMSAALIKLDDLRVLAQGDEPRIQDLKLAEALEYKAAYQIRELINRNRPELERYGGLSCRTINSSGPQGGRPSQEYWPNEAQAILICMRSDAPRAADVRQEVITVYQAWRRGKLASVSETPITKELRSVLKHGCED